MGHTYQLGDTGHMARAREPPPAQRVTYPAYGNRTGQNRSTQKGWKRGGAGRLHRRACAVGAHAPACIYPPARHAPHLPSYPPRSDSDTRTPNYFAQTTGHGGVRRGTRVAQRPTDMRPGRRWRRRTPGTTHRPCALALSGAGSALARTQEGGGGGGGGGQRAWPRACARQRLCCTTATEAFQKRCILDSIPGLRHADMRACSISSASRTSASVYLFTYAYLAVKGNTRKFRRAHWAREHVEIGSFSMYLCCIHSTHPAHRQASTMQQPRTPLTIHYFVLLPSNI